MPFFFLWRYHHDLKRVFPHEVRENPVHIPHPKVDELVRQAKGVGIFGSAEYPGALHKEVDKPLLLYYNETNNTKGGIIMKKADVHVIVAMLATLVSMFTVMAMMFMRFFG